MPLIENLHFLTCVVLKFCFKEFAPSEEELAVLRKGEVRTTFENYIRHRVHFVQVEAPSISDKTVLDSCFSTYK